MEKRQGDIIRSITTGGGGGDGPFGSAFYAECGLLRDWAYNRSGV